jgi:subtilase family serine protease
VGIYLSRDAVISTTDTWLGYRWVPSLAAGATSTGTTSVTIPGNLAPGTWWIGAIADYASQMPEMDETNNALAGNAVTVVGPDLVPASVSGPATALTGATITISSTVKAAASGANASGFPVAFYLSSNPAVSTANVYLGQRWVPSLAAGASSSGDTAVTIPSTIAGGTYYLKAVVDPWNSQLETDETNNVLVGNAITIVGPDIVVTSATGPVSGITGGSITVPNTVMANATGGNTPGFYVGVFLSTDPVITASDTLLGWRYVPPLAPGAESTDATTVTLPTNLGSGTYYLGVIADDFLVTICDEWYEYCDSYIDQAKESDETNNFYVVGSVDILGPDLTLDAVSGPATALTGRSIVVHDTVRAIGGGGAGAFSVSYYLSRDATITTSDVYLGRRDLVGLGAGQTSTADTVLTIPLGLAPGAYTIGAIVDPYGWVIESDETNNALAGNPVAVAGPDLLETAVSAPATGYSGSTVTVSDTAAASASGGDAGGFRVGIYLSRDPVITSSDTWIGSRYVPALAAGATGSGTTTVTIPGYLSPGTWYIGAIADYLSQYAEPDEANNAIAGNAIEIIGPDLVAASVTGPASALTGSAITISSTVTARSTGATASGFQVSLYLSADPVITTGDVYLGNRYVASLASGASSSGDTTVTIPATLAGGTYYLGAIVDPSNSVKEGDETNNAVAGNAITIVAPDLVAAAVSGPATAVAGGTIQVQDTVLASAVGGAAPEFYVGIFLSSDPVITANDLLLGYRYVPGLGPGGESSASTTVTIPAGLAPGTYHLGVIADDFVVTICDEWYEYCSSYIDQAKESDEANNALAGNAVVVVRP